MPVLLIGYLIMMTCAHLPPVSNQSHPLQIDLSSVASGKVVAAAAGSSITVVLTDRGE